jgi:PAS domain S-box
MKPILLVAPYEDLYEQAKEIITKHNDLEIILAHLDEAVQIAQDGVNDGVEIIISRGGTQYTLEHCGLNVPIVEIPIAPYDMVSAIHKAKKYGKNICVIGFDNVIRGVEKLGSILDVNIMAYLVYSEVEAESAIRESIGIPIDVVLGGSLAEKLAKKFGIPTVKLETSSNVIEYSINEARKILLITRQEKEKAEQYKAILHYINEGIIAVDKCGIITIYNPAAEKIIGLDREFVFGKKIEAVIKNSKLIDLIKTNRPYLGQVHTYNNKLTLTNAVPINVNDEVVGAVATFEDVTKIQEYEHTIRTNLMKKGHVAKYNFSEILGKSTALLHAKDIALKYSKVDSTILIIGESGTGKEMFAQSIHLASSRQTRPFVAVNCAAIPINLLESELFGYEGGAFTGAKKEGKLGLFALAHGGTIFLDEIGEIPIELQARLLRVLQEREIRPIGADNVIPIDVRVIAATNRSLIEAVKSNKFRKDLYYRLNILKLVVPNLRDRKEDINLLCRYFLNKYTAKLNKQVEFSQDAFDILIEYPWPGNIRELQNMMERLSILCNQVITKKDILEMLDEYDTLLQKPEKPLKSIKKNLIIETLKECDGNRTLAAKKLKISRTQLWRYLKNN